MLAGLPVLPGCHRHIRDLRNLFDAVPQFFPAFLDADPDQAVVMIGDGFILGLAWQRVMPAVQADDGLLLIGEGEAGGAQPAARDAVLGAAP